MLRFASNISATIALTLFSSAALAQEVTAAKDPLAFDQAVLPILQSKCLNCHGDKKQKAGLDLRSKAAILKGGDGGPSLKPGSLKDSMLWEKIRTDEMPEGKVKLTAFEKDVI